MSKLEIQLLPYDVNKANELIRNKVTINNLLAGRIFASLVSLIKPDDTNFHEYEIPVVDISKGEHGGANYKQIKEALFNLVEKCNFERKLEGNDYEILSVFSKVGYRKNKLFCKFNEDMKPYLLELKANYTKYNLMEFLLLPSLYSQKLFELLKSWEKLGEVVLKLDELYRILDIPENYTYQNTKQKVLEKAYKDIHAKTTLKYEYEPIKKGRSFTHIRFIFSNKRMLPTRVIQNKEEQDKTSKENNKTYLMAMDCARNKKGICPKQDNKKAICNICQQFKFCDEILRVNKSSLI